jgi:arsenate reductase
VFLGKGVKLHQGFNDPAAVQGTDQEVLGAFRNIRDEIKKFVLGFSL